MRCAGSIAVVMLLFGSAGCGGSRGKSAAGGIQYAQGGTLTIAAANDPGNLDPLMTVLSTTRAFARLAYDVLVFTRPDGGFAPGLAEKWDIAARQTKFTVRRGVTCSDGSPLTPTDITDSINFVAEPKNQSPLLGTVLTPGVRAIADDSAGTVVVSTAKPNAFLLNEISNLFIVCKAGLADHKKLRQATIGTGPWVLKEVVANDHYTLEKRPGYAWGPDGATLDQPGVPDKVVVRVLTNQTTTANLLLSGEVNLASVQGSDRARFKGRKLATVDTRYPLGETFFNQAAGRPGANAAVRRAMIVGSDLTALGKVATGQTALPSTGLVSLEPKPCNQDTVQGSLPGFDREQARHLLDRAGWIAGPDGVRVKAGKPLAFKFLYPAGAGSSAAAGAELLVRQWRDIGATVQLRAITSTQLNDVLFASGDWDAGWIPLTVNLPSQLVSFFSGPAAPKGTNFAHVANSAYTSQVSAAAADPVIQSACAKWNSGEHELFRNVDVVPMFDQTVPTYLVKAQAQFGAGELIGSSLRLLAR